jgi:hypothetical protein
VEVQLIGRARAAGESIANQGATLSGSLRERFLVAAIKAQSNCAGDSFPTSFGRTTVEML